MTFDPYEHQARYYETDQMGIIHHSNHIRWMEEARLDLLEKIGCGYKAMEDAGIISPILAVSCEYKDMVRFDDTVCIQVKVKEYNGYKITISYVMTDKASGKVCALAESKHCFMTKEGRFVSLKKDFPQWDERLRQLE